MNNADLMVRTLEAAGVRWVFGVPSGPVLPLIEALRGSSVSFVLTASETSAAFMAQAVGALTGVPGVCVSTLGPGATNLATGVGAAWLDRTPLIAITCNVETAWLERRVQMRIDHRELFKPLTKASYSLRGGEVAWSLTRALSVATAEPPGPVHLDLPEDVALAEALEAPSRPGGFGRTVRPVPEEAFEKARAVLRSSRRPVLVGGLELARTSSYSLLPAFCERHRIPFVATLHAKGFLPESHAWYAGVLGRARRSDVLRFLQQADLILAAGYDPVEINYEEWVGSTPVVHLGSERAEDTGQVRFAVNTGGDLDGAIRLLTQFDSEPPKQWQASEVEAHRRALDEALRPGAGGLAAHHVLDALRSRLPEDGTLVYDVGAHTHQIATQWRTDRPNSCLSTNGWSSMGYGIPAAYAARLAQPERPVVAVIGDGCFQMTAGELATGRRLGLAVPVIVLNDGWLSLLKVKQERRGFGLSGVQLGEPYESPPHYFGVPCRAARDGGELEAALDWALALAGPSVVEVSIDAEPYSKTVYD